MPTFKVYYSFGGFYVLEAPSEDEAQHIAESTTMRDLLSLSDMSHYIADDIEVEPIDGPTPTP